MCFYVKKLGALDVDSVCLGDLYDANVVRFPIVTHAHTLSLLFEHKDTHAQIYTLSQSVCLSLSDCRDKANLSRLAFMPVFGE